MQLSDDPSRLRHIVVAASEVLFYTEGVGFDEFQRDIPLQHFVAYNLAIIGEAASRISKDLRQAHDEVPWAKMIGLRNRIIHAYFDTDFAIVFKTARESLPGILDQVRKILDDLERNSP